VTTAVLTTTPGETTLGIAPAVAAAADAEAPDATCGPRCPSIITVETRDHRPSYRMPGACCLRYTNLGAGQHWDGKMTKVEVALQWLRSRAAQEPDKIQVFADGSDTAAGGCTDAELLGRYQTIVQASGGRPVVAGADTKFWPSDMRGRWRYDRLRSRRAAVLGAFGLGDWAYREFLESPKAEYQYANSGFLMGPTKSMIKVYECMHAASTERDDQQALTDCLFGEAEDLLTIDYAGALVLTGAGVEFGSVLAGEGGRLRNQVTGLVQCFAHLNFPDPFPEHFVEKLLA